MGWKWFSSVVKGLLFWFVFIVIVWSLNGVSNGLLLLLFWLVFLFWFLVLLVM